MLEIKRTAITLDEKELLELEEIVTDNDEKEALRFLQKKVYDKAALSQRRCEVFRAGNKKDDSHS